MPRVPPFDRPAAYEDLVALPDHLVAEIVDGELHASPRPASRHGRAGTILGGRLTPAYDEGRGGPGGWWIQYDPALHLGRDVLVPDWAGWRRSRMPTWPDAPFFTLAPDWICEILSPSTASLDRGKKLAMYAREGVSHAWLVDPVARTLEVFRLEHGRWMLLGSYGGADVVRAEPFGEIDLPLQSLWTDSADTPGLLTPSQALIAERRSGR